MSEARLDPASLLARLRSAKSKIVSSGMLQTMTGTTRFRIFLSPGRSLVRFFEFEFGVKVELGILNFESPTSPDKTFSRFSLFENQPSMLLGRVSVSPARTRRRE